MKEHRRMLRIKTWQIIAIACLVSVSICRVYAYMGGAHCTYEGRRKDANNKVDSCFGPPCRYEGQACTAIDMPAAYYCTSCSDESCICNNTNTAQCQRSVKLTHLRSK
jgi:hypothetical protein